MNRWLGNRLIIQTFQVPAPRIIRCSSSLVLSCDSTLQCQANLPNTCTCSAGITGDGSWSANPFLTRSQFSKCGCEFLREEKPSGHLVPRKFFSLQSCYIPPPRCYCSQCRLQHHDTGSGCFIKEISTWDPHVYIRAHWRPSFYPILSQFNRVHSFTNDSSKISFNIVFIVMVWSTKSPLPLNFLTKCSISCFPVSVTYPVVGVSSIHCHELLVCSKLFLRSIFRASRVFLASNPCTQRHSLLQYEF